MVEEDRKDDRCFMIRYFSPHRVFCRLFGCLYIQNLSEKSFHKAKATWKTPYTLYSLSCLLAMTYAHGSYIVERADALDLRGHFADSLVIILVVTSTAKVVVNITCFLPASKNVLAFFHKCKNFELSSSFQPPSLRDMCKRDWLLYMLRTSFFAFKVLMVILKILFYLEMYRANIDGTPNYGFATAVVVSTLGFAFYDALMYLVTASTFEVLVWYVRAQREAFEKVLKYAENEYVPTNIFSDCELTAARKVEAVRVNLCSIKEMKSFMNSIWSPSICVTTACIVWVDSISLYAFLTGSVYGQGALLTYLYAVHSSLNFMELATISQMLHDGVENLRESARSAPTLGRTDAYCRQLQFLYDSLNPAQMCISGGGFFRLNSGLIVSMTGVLITYTVILVQTSH